MDIEISDVIKRLDYDPETGFFVWKADGRVFRRGDVAGSLNNQGYWTIGLMGKRRSAHRLAWMHFYREVPRLCVDHIDGNRANNSIKNLRIATRRQNNMNMKVKSTTGFKGVSHHKLTGKFQAAIKIDGKNHHLGLFHTAYDAHVAYVSAAKLLFGQYYRSE